MEPQRARVECALAKIFPEPWPGMKEVCYRFTKKYGIAIVALLALWIYGIAVAKVTEHRVRKEVEEELTHYWRGQVQAALDEQEQRRMSESLLTGEESLQAAIDAESVPLAKFINGYRVKGNASKQGAKTAACCVIARADNPAYPSTIDGVINQELQWQFYSDDNPVRSEDLDLAKDILTMWHAGQYPNGLTNEFVYMEWMPGDIVLRNSWEKDSRTSYWRYPE